VPSRGARNGDCATDCLSKARPERLGALSEKVTWVIQLGGPNICGQMLKA
jgi:hypothetical protein